MEKQLAAFTDSETLLLRAVRRLLRPLVRLFIQKNIPLQACIDTLKEMYVSAAEDSLARADLKATDSQISLMTGIHRKDVRRFRDRAPDLGSALPHVSLGAALVAAWAGDPQYIDVEGKPAPLPYTNDRDPAFSFCALAESISSDVRPRAILDELLRLNIVRWNEITDQIFLNTGAFVPQDGWEEKLYYFGRNGGDHLEAAVSNILSPQPRYFDRSVYYGGLTRKSVAELEEMARDGGMKLLRAINRRAFQLAESDKQADPEGAKLRFNFGAYFYTDAEDRGESAE